MLVGLVSVQDEVKDAVEVSRILGLSKARVSQLLDLTLLPVEVQERVLFAEAVGGREPVTERQLRLSPAQKKGRRG